MQVISAASSALFPSLLKADRPGGGHGDTERCLRSLMRVENHRRSCFRRSRSITLSSQSGGGKQLGLSSCTQEAHGSVGKKEPWPPKNVFAYSAKLRMTSPPQSWAAQRFLKNVRFTKSTARARAAHIRKFLPSIILSSPRTANAIFFSAPRERHSGCRPNAGANSASAHWASLCVPPLLP